MLRSDDGVLILPIREKLNIFIQESFIADDLDYESCYVSEFPCCVNGPYTTTTTTLPCPSCEPCSTPTPTPSPSVSVTPTPTPSITPTPSPTPTTPEQLITDALLIGTNEYLNVGLNLYLKIIN
jgi:hypothetical protein